MRVIISGGGSGGHIFPAIAIANELMKRDSSTEILFVGAKDKLEMEKVPLAGYKIVGLWISGWHRKEIMRNILFPVKLMMSLLKARKILKKFNPDIVVGVGGFASGPILEMATRAKYPTLIQEQNSYPGKANLLLAKKVDRICVAYQNMERFFPAEKITRTGNPVRLDLKRELPNKTEALEYFSLIPNKKTLFIMGGSLGAKSINKAISTIIMNGLDESIQLIWQIGNVYWPDYRSKINSQNVAARPFIDRMDLAYDAADLMLCRAGALTIAELSYLGKPAILVPSPNVAEDHQTKNAEALRDEKAAIILKDSELDEKLKTTIDNIINDEVELETLSHNISRLAQPKAIHLIADEILKLVA